MSILAFLPSRLLRQLQFALGPECDVIVVASWERLWEILESEPVTVAVIDPSTESARNAIEYQRMHAAFPSLPVIAYVPLTAEAFRAVAELSRLGLDHVILYSHDSSGHLVSMIDQVRMSPLAARMAGELRPLLDFLPVALAAVIEDMFHEPHRYPGVGDIAVRAKITVARLYRSCDGAGLASPKRLLTAARLLRAYAYLADPGHTVRAVSSKVGFGHPRVFAAHSSEAFGVNPSRLTSHVSDAQAVERLLLWCRHSLRESREHPPL